MKIIRSRKRAVFFGVFLVTTTLLSSCILWTNDMVAVGTESWRINVVIQPKVTEGLDNWRISTSSSQTRQLIIDNVPPKITLNKVWALVCTLSAPLCAMGMDKATATFRSWFISDIRTRSDFAGDLHAARLQHDCFAWTGWPERNLTTKPPGNSGCDGRL